MPPAWLDTLAAAYVPLSIAGALAVLADIVLLGRRQRMGVMEAVWPLTMLYWGPPELAAYARFGRAGAPHDGRRGAHADRPMWQAAFVGATHCGAGRAFGDFLGDWAAFALGFTLFGSELAGKLLFAFVLAYLFGIAFQYLSVAPMRGLSLWKGIVAASRSIRSRCSPTRSACSAGWPTAPGSIPACSRRLGPIGC